MPDFITLDALVHNTAVAQPTKTAIIDDASSLTYAEFDALIDRVAASLQAEGFKPQDVISICAYSTIKYAATFLGALRAGIAVAPLALSSTPADFAAMLKDGAAKILFMDGSAAELMGEAARRFPKRVALDDSDFGEAFSAWTQAAPAAPSPVAIDPEWVFNIIYSSGTTGTPKGIVHTHGLRWRQYGQLEPLGYGPDAITILSTPLYSNTTLVAFNPTFAGGGTVVLMKKFDARGFLELSEKLRATHTMLVPVQYRRIMAVPDFDRLDLSAYVMKHSTSAPFAATLKADVLKRWPGGLSEVYGMTEGGGTCRLLAHENPDKLHTVGQPMPDHDIRLLDGEQRVNVDQKMNPPIVRAQRLREPHHPLPLRAVADENQLELRRDVLQDVEGPDGQFHAVAGDELPGAHQNLGIGREAEAAGARHTDVSSGRTPMYGRWR